MMITLFNGARRVDIPGLKRVQSIDPLAKDPENHATPRGKNVAHFSSIVNDGRKTAQAEAKEYTGRVKIEARDNPGDVHGLFYSWLLI